MAKSVDNHFIKYIIDDCLRDIKFELELIQSKTFPKFSKHPCKRIDVKERVLILTKILRNSITDGGNKPTNLKQILKKFQSDARFCNELGQLTKLKFCNIKSKESILLILHLLNEIVRLFTCNTTVSKRELYYQNKEWLRSTDRLESILQFLSCLLNVPLWELGILSSSKGLVAGSLFIKCNSDDVYSCSNQSGLIIPMNIPFGAELRSSAKFALIVEKDAVFQKLISEEFLNVHGPCILLTGKGYPDISTRVLVKLIFEQLSIPIFALMDADPYGIHIMFVYRFGSVNNKHLRDILAVPEIKWLGIHPSDISDFLSKSERLTAKDTSKINSLLALPHINEHCAIENQLKQMLLLGLKTDIEGIGTLSNSYLTDVYFPMKICSKQLI